MDVKVPRCKASTSRGLMSIVPTRTKTRCSKCGNSAHIECFSMPLLKHSSVKPATSFDTLAVFVTRKSQRYANYKQVQYMPKKVPFAVNLKMTAQVWIPFYMQVKLKHTQAILHRIPRPTHLITNLAYRLKPHNTRNLYLRARLDICVDVNIMPASVYRLGFLRST